MTRCRQQLGEMGQMMLGRPLSAQAFLTHILLGNTVGDVLFEDSPASAARVMANRAVISNGLATMSVANEWMPTIRDTVFGFMLRSEEHTSAPQSLMRSSYAVFCLKTKT